MDFLAHNGMVANILVYLPITVAKVDELPDAISRFML